jgi:hypothetical protein
LARSSSSNVCDLAQRHISCCCAFSFLKGLDDSVQRLLVASAVLISFAFPGFSAPIFAQADSVSPKVLPLLHSRNKG